MVFLTPTGLQLTDYKSNINAYLNIAFNCAILVNTGLGLKELHIIIVKLSLKIGVDTVYYHY